MTYRCTTCLRNWHPYQTDRGTCVTCGAGTRRSNEPPDPDNVAVHREALAERAERERSGHLHREFEEFYANREADRLRAESAPAPLPLRDELDAIRPPSVDPRRRAA